MSTTLTIASVAIDVPQEVVLGSLVAFNRDGYQSLSFYTRGGTLPPLPNPYINKEARLTINSVLRFAGTIMSAHPEYHDGLGWVVAYSAHGLASRMERFPHTDAGDGTDTSVFNGSPEDGPSYNAARAGRTVGQIIATILGWKDNGDALTARGVGNLTWDPTNGVYTLPASTANDLAALTLIPQGPLMIGGEKFWHALQGLISEWAPRCMLHVEPGGDIRFLSLASWTPHTFTMGTDPILPSELSRDIGECYSRVAVRGAPLAVMALLKTSDGTLTESFLWDGYATNAAAKAAWTPGQFHQPSAQDTGTCTCPDTLHVVVTSSSASYSWSADWWDQTSAGRHGVLNLIWSVATGVDIAWTARIVANTSLSAGGTSTLTIDAPLPHLNFDRYTITGLNQTDGSVVWRRYRIASTALWPRVTSQSTFPQAFINPGGGATLTSTPMGAVRWPISGTGPPYNSFPLPFTYDGNGSIYFAEPTYTVANNAAPADVWCLLPINVSVNLAVAPADVGGVPQHDGTVHSVDGVSETLIVPINSWRDPANQVNMQAYAQEVLECVKQAHIDGSIVYLGLYEPALAPGMKANVAGSGYATQWESVDLNVVAVELSWNPAGPTSWVTRLTCTNRMSHLGAAAFLRPERGWQALGSESPTAGFNPALGLVDTGEGGMMPTRSPLGGLPSYRTPGDLAPQSSGAIPTSMADLGLPTSPADLGIETPGFVTPEAGRPASRTPEEQRASHHAAAEQRQQQLQQQRAAETARVQAARAAPAQELAQAQQERREQAQQRQERAQQLRAQHQAKVQADRQARANLPRGGFIGGEPEPDAELAE